MAIPNNLVAEMQGLYGPFTITERVVQKIWLRGDFDQSRLVLTDGRPLRIRSSGRWNLLGGPDFIGARLGLGDSDVIGDVEVHFHVADWRAHGHEADRAYGNVALHVVMFPPVAGERQAVRGDGRQIPTLVLLPLLHRDLEEHASDDALEAITARDDWERIAALAATPPADLPPLLRRHAEKRWRQKVRFAHLRLAKLGWTTAAHHMALEILGYRHNRAAMLGVATRYPLERWVAGLDPREILLESGARWQIQGVRPANHPLARLRQYASWVATNPRWTEQLDQHFPPALKSIAAGATTMSARRTSQLSRTREVIARVLLGGAVGGTRLDNLVCDGFLPLVAARTENDLSGVWFHWYLGDVPAQVRIALPKLGVAGRGAPPLCHGWAQGLLGWILEHEARASR